MKLKLDRNIQNKGSPQEESVGMGDEASLDMSVGVDPYDTHSYWIRISIPQSSLHELGP